MIDDMDNRILAILQSNARTSTAEIARRVDMAPSAVYERIKKLEERGTIRGYTARLDARTLGLGLLAFVFVRAEERVGETATAELLAGIPEVQEVHHIAGEDCYLVKVRAADTEALGLLLREGFGALPSVRSTRTTIVLETLKETSGLPVRLQADGDNRLFARKPSSRAAAPSPARHGTDDESDDLETGDFM